jgi:APA family basic amino acid/polyamine antiporter
MIFFGLTGVALLIFRSRGDGADGDHIRAPLHPVSTLLFIAAAWAISLTTIVRHPTHAGVGMGILAVGAVVYMAWRKPVRVSP